jgi:[FeFe] hydrogenase H-cluster maturation GTPase HydF
MKGTTTDPVQKAMELLPIGPVMIIDTPGYDDMGKLGQLRVKKTKQILNRTDLAVLVVDGQVGLSEPDYELLTMFKEKMIPHLLVFNKADLIKEKIYPEGIDAAMLYASALSGDGVHELKETLARMGASREEKPALVSDLISPGEFIMLVIPIDDSAPKGRLILPQQQVIRELIDNGASAVVCQPSELKGIVERLGKTNIRFVITDSQAFKEVDSILDKDIELTSFSIVFARQKGDLKTLCEGASTIKKLQDGDRVLIAEGCTHRRQCGDIGTEKIPRLLKKFTGRNLDLTFASGGDFPLDENKPPKLVIHCGGCMLTRRAVMNRLSRCTEVGVPIVNYGVAIALMNGIETKDGSCMVKR